MSREAIEPDDAELVPEPRPVRTAVQAGLADGALVEIDAIARRPG